MINTTVIRDVKDSIKDLLTVNIDELATVDAISYKSPSDLTSVSSTTLSLFLFKFDHNPYLREEEYAAKGAFPEAATAMIDFRFLLTPFANDMETEDVILEKIVEVFFDNSVLTGTQLKGNLEAIGNTSLRIIPHTLNLDETNKLWTSFPNTPYKLCVCYGITGVIVKPVPAV